jgi:hypothetical protein
VVDWRAALLKRLARRFHIGDDVLRHLSTFQRLGENLEVEAPSEMLPVGVRTLVRALRTRSAAQIRPTWLWPYWLERQLDPEDPAFVPRGHLPFTTNVTHRNWTAVGNPGSPWEAIVDPAGLVTPAHDAWSVDWWVHSDERWHLPSREAQLDQRLTGTGPIVETSISVPAGEAVQRVYAVEVVGEEHVVIEVDNRSDNDIEVAFAVRPYNPEGLAVVEEIVFEDGVVVVDGEVAMVLPEAPTMATMSTYHDGDSLHQLVDRSGVTDPEGEVVEDPAGFAQAAVLYEVPAGGSTRIAVPLPPGRRRTVSRALERMPDQHQVADRWERVLDRGMRVTLPDEEVQAAIEANRAYMLLFHDPGDITPGPATYHRFWFRDAAYQLLALDRWGLHDESADVLRTYPDRQRNDGFFYSQWREWDANGAAIFAIAEHHRLTGDDVLLRALAPSVRHGVNWIERARHGRVRRVDLRFREREVVGLLPAGISAEHLGPFDYYYWDDLWCLRGMVDAAYVARQIGEPRAARAIDAGAQRFRDDIVSSIRRAADRIGEPLIPAGPFREPDAGMIGSLVACHPLSLFEPHDPLISGTVEAIRDRFCLGPAFFQAIAHTGLGTYLTLQLAAVELERGEMRAWERLRWLLGAATPTWTWPEAIHPQLPGGCMGDGHHGWAAADVLNFVRCVLLREQRDGSVALLGIVPPTWLGEPIVVRHAPTHHGHLSYEVRWDGDLPIVSWEWETGEGAVLRAPGLDPSWEGIGRSGEDKLAGVR